MPDPRPLTGPPRRHLTVGRGFLWEAVGLPAISPRVSTLTLDPTHIQLCIFDPFPRSWYKTERGSAGAPGSLQGSDQCTLGPESSPHMSLREARKEISTTLPNQPMLLHDFLQKSWRFSSVVHPLIASAHPPGLMPSRHRSAQIYLRRKILNLLTSL